MHPFALEYLGQPPGQSLDLGGLALIQQQDGLFEQGEGHVVGLPPELEGSPCLRQEAPGFQRAAEAGGDAALQPRHAEELVFVSSLSGNLADLLHQV